MISVGDKVRIPSTKKGKTGYDYKLFKGELGDYPKDYLTVASIDEWGIGLNRDDGKNLFINLFYHSDLELYND